MDQVVPMIAARMALGIAPLVVAGLVIPVGAAAPAVSAAPVLSLVRATSTQTIEKYDGQPINIASLAFYVVADYGEIEFRNSRARYSDPVMTTLTSGPSNNRTVRDLPLGLTKDVNILTNMFHLKVQDKNGVELFNQEINFCPNSARAARSQVNGAVSSPYALACGAHPFAIASVLGIADHWASPALNDAWDSEPLLLDGKPGEYTAEISMNKPYREALGLPAAEASARIKLNVVNAKSATETNHAAMTMASSDASATGGSSSDASVDDALPAHHAPDLRSLPASGISLGTKYVTTAGKRKMHSFINFGATVWNAGPAPLVVDGFRRGDNPIMDAHQYFLDSSGREIGSLSAGTLEWDPRRGHRHWHFTSFATYDLLDSTQHVSARSGKEAFCLTPTDPIDMTVRNANWKPGAIGLHAACGQENSLSIREALDVGWGDTYDQSRPGQSFDVTNLPAGIYFIRVLANPDRKLIETSYENNSALRKLKLIGSPGAKRRLAVYPYEGISS